MVKTILFRVTTDLFKLVELPELTMVHLKENLLQLSILSMIREFLLMEKEYQDKSSPLLDYNSQSKSSMSVEESLQESLEKLSLNKAYKRILKQAHWEDLMLNKPEDNNLTTLKDLKLSALEEDYLNY